MNGMSCLSLVCMFVAIMAIPIIGVIVIPIQEYDGKPKDIQNDEDDTYWRMMGLRPPENRNYWNVADNGSITTADCYKSYKKENARFSTKIINSSGKQDIISVIRTPDGLKYSIKVDGTLPDDAIKKEVVITY